MILPAIAATVLSLTSPAQADYLTKPRAKEAIRQVERKAVRQGYIDRFKVGRCTRRAPGRVRCYVRETLRFDDAELVMDGWTGVWLRDGKTVICYPGRRDG